jgi:hypothetical protein
LADVTKAKRAVDATADEDHDPGTRPRIQTAKALRLPPRLIALVPRLV